MPGLSLSLGLGMSPRSATATPTPSLSVPTAANTTMLLHFDGTDAAVATTDGATTPHTVTFNGNAQLDTAFKKFGTASLLLDGTDDYLGTWTDAGFQFGSGAFSIFAWIRPTSTTGTRAILHHGYPSARAFQFSVSAGTLSFLWSNVGGTTTTGSLTSAAIITTNQWQLVGVTRAADGTIRLFHALDGATTVPVVATLNDATTTQTFNTAGAPASHIGVIGGAVNDFAGHIDELIVTKECLATAEFAMPTAQFSSLNLAVLKSAAATLAVYEPSNLSTMWQDRAGTTTQAAAGQPVGYVQNTKTGATAYHLSTNDDLRRPLATNGLTFDGSNDWLDFAQPAGGAMPASATVLFLVKSVSADAVFTGDGSSVGVMAQSGSATAVTGTVLVDGVSKATRGEVFTAAANGAFHTIEHAGADYSAFTALRFGGYAGFVLSGVLVPVAILNTAAGDYATALTNARAWAAELRTELAL